MKYQYINMDKSLIKKGGRLAVAITKEDFIKKFHSLYEKYEGEKLDIEDFKEEDVHFWYVMDYAKVAKDLGKVKFDDENTYCSKNSTPVIDTSVPNLLGINTLDNGLTFLGCMAGGDWEWPLFFIIYWDGKAFRGYIPSYGNMINLDFMTAFGSEGEYGIEPEEVLKTPKYIKLIADMKVSGRGGCGSESLTGMYMKEQGVKPASKSPVVVNWQAVEEDIRSRIVVTQKI